MKKAQTQAITLVLISGIVISLAGTAYLWGKPLIEKRSTLTQFSSAVKFMKDLDKSIVDMAGTCSSRGACEEGFTLPVPGTMRLDTDTNSLIYEFQVAQPLATEDEIPLNTGNLGEIARYGETPGVLTLQGTKEEGINTLKFVLRYRELDNDQIFRGYRIEFKKSGKLSGNDRLNIRYDGSETRSGAAANSGNLIVSKMIITFL